MVKRLRKVGNSQALLLDKALLELVGLEEGGAVEVTVGGGSIVLAPVNPRPVNPRQFQAALDRVVIRRRRVLKRLAQ